MRSRHENEKGRLRGLLHYNRGAQEGTRTPTVLPPLGPEPSASTNSATWASITRTATFDYIFSRESLSKKHNFPRSRPAAAGSASPPSSGARRSDRKPPRRQD